MYSCNMSRSVSPIVNVKDDGWTTVAVIELNRQGLTMMLKAATPAATDV